MATNSFESQAFDLKMVYLSSSKGKQLMRLSEEELRNLLSPTAKLLKDRILTFTPASHKKLIELFNKMTTLQGFKKLKKEDLAVIYLSLVQNNDNIFLLASLDEKIIEAWKNIVEKESLTVSTISNILRRKLEVTTMTSWPYNIFIEPAFYPLKVVDGGYYYFYSNDSFDYTLALLPEDRENIAKMIYGEDALKEVVCKELPKDEDLTIENFETDVARDLLFLRGIALSEEIDSSGPVKGVKLKKIKKTFQTSEFPSSLQQWPVDRIEMLVNSYFFFYDYAYRKGIEEKTTDLKTFAKFIVANEPYYLSGTRLGMLLPAFKGITKSWASDANSVAMTTLALRLILGGANGWSSLNNLYLRFMTSRVENSSKQSRHFLFGSDARRKHTLKRLNDEHLNSGQHRGSIRWSTEIDFPFILHWLKLLCATGLWEIAEVSPEKASASDPLEGMRYVRLTALGRYAFGFDKEYTSPKVKIDSGIDVDDTNCILTVDSLNCPYLFFLQQISTPISPTRFRLSPESFMKDCDDEDKVKTRIENLKSIIDIGKYPGLRKLLAEVETRMDAAYVIHTDYAVYKLKGELKGLIDFLTTVPEIRENIILAENGIFMVKRLFVPRLRLLCSRRGYIID